MDRQKEKVAIERLRAFEPSEKPYYLSGLEARRKNDKF